MSVTALHAAAGDGPTLGELKEMEASDDPAVRAEAREITKTVMAPLVAQLGRQSLKIHESLAASGSLAAIKRMQKDAFKVGGALDSVKSITALQGSIGNLLSQNDTLRKMAMVNIPAVTVPKFDRSKFEVPEIDFDRQVVLPPMPTHAADTAAATEATAEAVVTLVQVANAQHEQLGEMTAVLQQLVARAEATQARQDAEAAAQSRRFRITIGIAGAALIVAAVAAVAAVLGLF